MLGAIKKRSVFWVISVGGLLRLCLFLYGVSAYLSSRVELSTPFSSFQRILEASFLERNGIPPYSELHPILPQLVYILCDVIVALMLRPIARWAQSRFSLWCERLQISSSPFAVNFPDVVAVLYILSPLTLIACVSMNTTIFSNTAIVAALYFAATADSVLSMFCLAVASYLTIYPTLLVLPLLMLLMESNPPKPQICSCIIPSSENAKVPSFDPQRASPVVVRGVGWALLHIGYYLLFVCALLYISALFVGDWSYLRQVYGFVLLVEELTPNIGLWWYFFLEQFEHFHSFFIVLFHMQLVIFVIPVSVRFRHHALAVFWIFFSGISIFYPYPSVSELALSMGLLPLIWGKAKATRFLFVLLCVLAFVSMLLPVFWYLWIYQGSGNANFYYALTLVVMGAQHLLVTDIYSTLHKADFRLKHPASKHEDSVEKPVVSETTSQCCSGVEEAVEHTKAE